MHFYAPLHVAHHFRSEIKDLYAANFILHILYVYIINHIVSYIAKTNALLNSIIHETLTFEYLLILKFLFSEENFDEKHIFFQFLNKSTQI